MRLRGKRAELEGLAVRRAAETVTAEQLQEIRGILDRLFQMIRNLWDSTDWCRRIFAADATHPRASSAELEEIFRALRDGDPDAACASLQNEERRALAWLLERAERTPLPG